MSKQNGKHHKVLIVDDEDIPRLLLSRIIESLRLEHVKILLAEDGIEAVDIAERERPDLILLDVLLPKMNGYDVCQQIRRIPDYSPYIIILTARGDSGSDRQYAQDMGADDFMNKPFSASRLMNQINTLWGLR
jgi:DNA-binding response OmpR family regulator